MSWDCYSHVLVSTMSHPPTFAITSVISYGEKSVGAALWAYDKSLLVGVSASGRNHKRQPSPTATRSWGPKCRDNNLFGRKLSAGFNGESSDI